MMLDVCPGRNSDSGSYLTPHFSVLGAKSGFDSVEECFRGTGTVYYALETGLSSDGYELENFQTGCFYQLVSIQMHIPV